MAEKQIDGTVRMRDGTILYGNSVVQAGHLLEILEMFSLPVKVPEVRGYQSIFTTMEGHSYQFTYEEGKDYAEFRSKDFSCTVGVKTVRQELILTRNRLGLRGPKGTEWFFACVRIMKKKATLKQCPGCGYPQVNGPETESGRCLDCDRTSPSTGNHFKKAKRK